MCVFPQSAYVLSRIFYALIRCLVLFHVRAMSTRQKGECFHMVESMADVHGGGEKTPPFYSQKAKKTGVFNNVADVA